MNHLKRAIEAIPGQAERPKNKLVKIEIKHPFDDNPDPSYLEQEEFEDRLGEYKRGDFSFIGIQAEAEIHVPFGAQWSDDKWVIHHVSSPGLWGIESDSGDEYFEEVAREELAQLKDQLEALNVDLSNFDELAQEAIANI